MTLAEARALRDEIREHGLHCVVPLGYGPVGYSARIYSGRGGGPAMPVDFSSRSAWRAWKDERERREQLRLSRPRSPIEAMIDQACGINPGDYA